MILVTHFACCHQYKGYWRSCPLGWSYFTVMPGLNLRAGGAHAPEFTIRFHDLRHTFATLSLKSGVDVKTLSGALGHYSAGFTLNTYTHATAQMKQDAADTIGGFISQQMR